jgi:hypothetical protein
MQDYMHSWFVGRNANLAASPNNDSDTKDGGNFSEKLII